MFTVPLLIGCKYPNRNWFFGGKHFVVHWWCTHRHFPEVTEKVSGLSKFYNTLLFLGIINDINSKFNSSTVPCCLKLQKECNLNLRINENSNKLGKILLKRGSTPKHQNVWKNMVRITEIIQLYCISKNSQIFFFYQVTN